MVKYSTLGILVMTLFLTMSSIKVQADAVGSYQDRGAVGFTGKMPDNPTEPPGTEVLSPEEKGAISSPTTIVPNVGSQTITLPATGDSSNKVFFIAASLTTVLILFLSIKMDKNIKKHDF